MLPSSADASMVRLGSHFLRKSARKASFFARDIGLDVSEKLACCAGGLFILIFFESRSAAYLR